MKRRDFLKAASAAAGGSAAVGAAEAASGPPDAGALAQQSGNNTTTAGGNGTTTAGNGSAGGGNQTGGNQTDGNQSGGGAAPGGNVKPDFGGWLEGVDGGYTDARGQDEVTVQVGAQGNGGNLAFAPAGVWVDQGATVVWEWTGQGSGHNVHAVQGASFQSEQSAEEGHTFTHTFDSGGIVNYQCDPHAQLGMKGAVAVGGEVPTVSTGGGGSAELSPHEMGVPFQAHFVGLATVVMMLVSLVYTFFVLKYGESRHASSPGRE